MENIAKNQKVSENCTAKQICPELRPKTFASWLPKFATAIKIWLRVHKPLLGGSLSFWRTAGWGFLNVADSKNHPILLLWKILNLKNQWFSWKVLANLVFFCLGDFFRFVREFLYNWQVNVNIPRMITGGYFSLILRTTQHWCKLSIKRIFVKSVRPNFCSIWRVKE